MSILFFLISISLCIAVLFLFSFFWAVKSGQFSDPYTPSIRILLDDVSHRNTIQEEDQEPNVPNRTINQD